MVRLLLILSVLLSTVLCTSLGCLTKEEAKTTPPSVVTSDATGATDNGATLNGNLADLGTAATVTFSFQWGTSSGSYPNETTAQVRTATGAFSFDLTGLNADTTYYFRVKAVGDGTTYGSEESLKTSQAPKLMILSHRMDTSVFLKIVGQAKNISNQTLSYASVEVKFRDAQGAVLDTSGDYIFNLSPGDVWNFEVTYYGDRWGDNFTGVTYEISVGGCR
jgi:hypothetical protein